MATRIVALALLFIVDKVALKFLLGMRTVNTVDEFGPLLRIAQQWMSLALVSFLAALAIFTLTSPAQRLLEVNREVRTIPLRWGWLGLHAAFVLALAPLVAALMSGDYGPLLSARLVVALLLPCASGAGLTALAAAAPWRFWRRAAEALGIIWAYASIAALVAVTSQHLSQSLWASTATLTFELVRRLLSLFIPSLRSDPTDLTLSTSRFDVQIGEPCSGLEGMALMLVFCCSWLLYYRREYIFPRALILIPCALLLIFILNVGRIAALLLIGNAGYPDIAINGFHSQAGWIAFNVAAGAIVIVSRSSGWINHRAIARASPGTENRVAPYLMPFLVILATGMLVHAASGRFEALYPLRLLTGAVAIWIYRRRIQVLDWRVSWHGPAVGIAVFAVWVIASHFFTAPGALPTALAEMSPAEATLWIAARCASAVIIVPLAEELGLPRLLDA